MSEKAYVLFWKIVTIPLFLVAWPFLWLYKGMSWILEKVVA